MDHMVNTCQQHFAGQGLKIACVGVATDMTFKL
jgi:hypothetical protein